MHNIITHNIIDIAVLILIPSPMKYHVKMLIIIIPDANESIRPGHKSPLKCSTAYLVDSKNMYDTTPPAVIDIKTAFFLAHSLKNCELSCNHTNAWPTISKAILINNFI